MNKGCANCFTNVMSSAVGSRTSRTRIPVFRTYRKVVNAALSEYDVVLAIDAPTISSLGIRRKLRVTVTTSDVQDTNRFSCGLPIPARY